MHHVYPPTAPVGRPRIRARRPVRAILVTALAVGGAACAAPDPGPAADTTAVGAALDSVYATFTEAYARANVQLLMEEVYASDAFYLPPGSPILEGQDQFRGQFSFLERYARSGGPGPQISFDIIHREIAGDLAYDIGVYTLRSPDAPADTEGTRGKFIVIWNRIHGEWRIKADGFSGVE